MNDLLRGTIAIALMWLGYVILKSQRQLVLSGYGWLWALASGLYAFIQWPANSILGIPLIVPTAVTIMFLLAIVGSVPNDEVDAAMTLRSRWFRRGLAAAVAGAAGGMASWASTL